MKTPDQISETRLRAQRKKRQQMERWRPAGWPGGVLAAEWEAWQEAQ
ncbi:MAG: hypothetical protein QOE68_283 [Thermoanaerobaculia bacterium]|jgi:hypothetical protein|nr:hypothetical protein [Thermoanaerobaculia bacterium]